MASLREIYLFLLWPLQGSFPHPQCPQDLFSYLFICWTGSPFSLRLHPCPVCASQTHFSSRFVWDHGAGSICWLSEEDTSEGPAMSHDLWHLAAIRSQNWLFSFNTYFAICPTLAPIWRNYGVFLIASWQFWFSCILIYGLLFPIFAWFHWRACMLHKGSEP